MGCFRTTARDARRRFAGGAIHAGNARILAPALLVFAAASLAGGGATASANVPSGKIARKPSKAKCHTKAKPHGKHAQKCPATKPKKKPATPALTTAPSAVNLSAAELALFNELNQERVASGVKALSTSSVLQAIAEKRVHEMAAQETDYAGHDVVVDLKEAGICTRAQREISGIGIAPGTREKEEAERRALIEKVTGHPVASTASVPDEEEEEELIPKIRVDPAYTVIGVAVVVQGTAEYYVEDFATPC